MRSTSAAAASLRAEMQTKAWVRNTVPQIWIGERHVGGCDDLYALERDGKLDPLLAAEQRVDTRAEARS